MSFVAGTLTGKTAIVTSGATGLWATIVRMPGQLAAKLGAKAVVISRKEENLRSAVKRFVDEEGIDVIYRVGDVRDAEGIAADTGKPVSGAELMVDGAARWAS